MILEISGHYLGGYPIKRRETFVKNSKSETEVIVEQIG